METAVKRRRLLKWTVEVVVLGLFLLTTGECILTVVIVRQLNELKNGEAEAAPRAIRSLDDRNPWIRAAAALAIVRLGNGANAAMPKLIALVEDGDVTVRCNAMVAIGSIGRDPECVPVLVRSLDHGDGETRRYAAMALGVQGAGSESAIDKLIEKIDDPHMGYMAARALGEIGPPAKRSIPAIIDQLKVPSNPWRAEFIAALGKFGADAAVGLSEIERFANDSDPLVSRSANDAIRAIRTQE